MKLNYKRTILAGLAFLSIMTFWQVYEAIIPLILRDTYNIPDGPAGIVMALDNILALFLLPVLGALSDRAGARMPFIVGGTAAASVLVMLIPILANNYGADSPAGMRLVFLIVLGLLLIVMAVYRSPAVALMADITPKPLRSQGNAVINLMGAVGGLYTLIMLKIAVATRPDGSEDYLYLFLSVALLMLVSVAVLASSIREKALVREMQRINYGVSPEDGPDTPENTGSGKKLPKEVMRSLIAILACIFLWFMGFNAVTTAFTKYATTMWTGGLDNASTCFMVTVVSAVASYIPIGIFSSKLGRRRMIRIGLIAASACFVFAAFFAREFSAALYPMFMILGFSQAAVTVNTFPMVWELSRFGNIGKYTGLYYTCSMAAQVITPIVSGYLLQWIGYDTLFPYAAVMTAAAIIPISLAKYGDSKPPKTAVTLAAFDIDD